MLSAEFMIPTWPDKSKVGHGWTKLHFVCGSPRDSQNRKRSKTPMTLSWILYGYYMDTRWYYHDAFQALLVVPRQRRANHSWVQDLHAEPDQETCAWLQSSCYSTRHLASFNRGRMIFHYIITYLPLLLLNFWITYPIWGHISTWNRTTPKSSKILERFWAHIRAHLFSTYWLNSVRLLLISAARAYMMDSSAASSPRIIKNHQDDLSSEEHLPTTRVFIGLWLP